MRPGISFLGKVSEAISPFFGQVTPGFSELLICDRGVKRLDDFSEAETADLRGRQLKLTLKCAAIAVDGVGQLGQ